MMKIKRILVIVLICTLAISNVGALSIGIAPPSFTIDDAQRGGIYDQRIIVGNRGNESSTCEFAGTGEIGDWVSFYASDGETLINMTEVPGKGSKRIIARFTIPNETANGSYTGGVSVQTIPGNAIGNATGGAAADVVLMLASQGTIVVTGKQNLTGIVRNITALDTEVNNTLRIKVEFQNTGDVIATPAINVTIATNDSLVDCIYYDKTGVMPGANETIPVEWDTTGQIAGNYSVNVSVSLNSEILAAQNLTVRILPPGTLKRAGDLIGMTSEGELSTAQTVKIVATFENTGAIDTNAKFVAEVYVNGNLTDEINSDELVVVPVGEKSDLAALLDLAIPGEYEIKGYVLYDGNKSTDTKELSFSVTTAEPAET
jgi:hypothetical protein